MWAVYFNGKYQYTTFESNMYKALEYLINDLEENEDDLDDVVSIEIKWRGSHGTGTQTQSSEVSS